ncbi:unnamed protein product [Cuscuta europaea]|uniref:LOB domain-containing protein n=1 Tax=Cuscuta europaea TaxID=41803 RepID=A0A9P0ZEF0_CUSEU|nr:unnamed protein product [Cuscuta europaea]
MSVVSLKISINRHKHVLLAKNKLKSKEDLSDRIRPVVMSSSSHSSGGGRGGDAAGVLGPCGACKFLRRKCVAGCIFAPFFDPEQGPSVFASVHKVFGASNFSKLLRHIPPHRRADAVVTVCFEAQARLRDPVYGCVSHIFSYQKQVEHLQAELSFLEAELAALRALIPPPPKFPSAPALQSRRQFGRSAKDSVDDGSSASSSATDAGVLQELTLRAMQGRSIN